MKKLTILYFFWLTSAVSQTGVCYVNGVTSGCVPNILTQTPTVPNYIISWGNAVTSLTGAAGSPIEVSSNIGVASPSYRSSDGANCNNASSVYSTAISRAGSIGLNNYIDYALGTARPIGQGVSILIYNPDPVYYEEASEYATYCSAGICGTPNNPGISACQLGVDIAFLQHAVAAGFKIVLSPAPEQSFWQSCGLTPGNVVSMTQVNQIACLSPVEQTMVAHLIANSIPVYKFNSIHEPNGSYANGTQITITTSMYTAVANNACMSVFSVSSSVKCGAGFTGGDGTFITDFLSNYGPHVNFIGLETYALYSSYASTMNSIASFCASAITAGLTCENTEGDPARDGPGVSEQTAYYGCDAQMWQTYGVNDTYAQVDCKFLARNHFSSCTRFSTQPFITPFDPVNTNNCFDPLLSSKWVMTHGTGSSPAKLSWDAGATWTGITIDSVTILKVTVQ